MGSARAGQFDRLVRSRHFRVAFLAFQFLWLNVIVPGHRRGVVSLPGMECSACAADAGHTVHACCPSGPKSPQPIPADKADRCAICFFAARLSPTVAIDFTHPPLRLIGVSDLAPELINHSPDFAFTYLGRAPPSAA
jgi:hypothetical protein